MDTRLAMSVAMGVMVVMVAMRVSGQGSNDCISKIVPCANFINSTTPPSSACCDPLLTVINNDVECLCNVLRSDALKSFNFTLDQALQLPAKCGKPVSTDACKVGAPSSPPGGTTSPPPAQSSTTVNSAAAISISTLVAMTVLAFLLDALH